MIWITLYFTLLLLVLMTLVFTGHPAAAIAWAAGTNVGYYTRWLLDKVNGRG